LLYFFFFQAEDGIRDRNVTGVQTCALPICRPKLPDVLPESVEDVWELWTTKAGLESWWGPEGFTTAVSKLDLRPRGEFEYAMTEIGRASCRERGKSSVVVGWMK